MDKKKKEETKEIKTPSQQYHLALHAMPSKIAFSAKVSYGKTTFQYVDFKALRAAVLPILDKHDLSVRYSTHPLDGAVLLTGSICHKDGVVINSFGLPLRTAGKPQDLGSEITYFKRYALAALCGVVSDKDDDGNFADKAEAERKSQEKKEDKPKEYAKKPKGSTKLKQAIDLYIQQILRSTSIPEFVDVKKEHKQSRIDIADKWPEYMTTCEGEQTKTFVAQIAEHHKRLLDQENMDKQQARESSYKPDGVDNG